MVLTKAYPDLKGIARRNHIPESVVFKVIERIKRSMKPVNKRMPVIENGEKHYYSVERKGIGVLNTCFGKFWQFEFYVDDT